MLVHVGGGMSARTVYLLRDWGKNGTKRGRSEDEAREKHFHGSVTAYGLRDLSLRAHLVEARQWPEGTAITASERKGLKCDWSVLSLRPGFTLFLGPDSLSSCPPLPSPLPSPPSLVHSVATTHLYRLLNRWLISGNFLPRQDAAYWIRCKSGL